MQKRFSRIFSVTLAALLLVNFNITSGLTGIDLASKVYAENKSMQVNFPESSSQYRSTTVTIPNLVRVSSATVNTGTVSYSVSGSNVTVTVDNGNPVSSYTESQYVSGVASHTGLSYPPSYISYSSGGYSGTLNRYSVENKGGYMNVPESRTFSATHSNTVTNYWDCKGNNYDNDESSPAPSSYYINKDGYSGYIPRTDTTTDSDRSYYCTVHNGAHRIKQVRVFTAHYSGTLTKNKSVWYDDYWGYYSGYIYGSTYYYYAYNVTLNYEINSPPIINVISPVPDQVFGETATSFVPTVSVSDPNGDTLTCKLYIDTETTPRDTKTVSNTATAQKISFNALNIGSLSEGAHTMKFTVQDSAFTQQATAAFKVDKTLPAPGSVSMTSTDKSISVSGSASDNIAMHDIPYQFSVNDMVSQWMSDTSYTFDNLSPNTLYTTKFKARDKAGNIANIEQSIYTKAQNPSLQVSGSGETTLVLSISDSNPLSTEYLISCGNQYIGADGMVKPSPEWITLDDKSKTVTGLQPYLTYDFKIKARNAAGEETSGSTVVSGTTLALPLERIDFTDVRKDSITISWDAVKGATAYEVEADGSVFSNGTSTVYKHSGLYPETFHTYRVRVINAGGKSSWSKPFTSTTLPERPGTPANVGAVANRTEITITWSAVADATGYDIEIDGTVQDNGTSLEYTHYGLEPDTTHKYRVSAKNAGGNSDWTDYITVATLPNPPDPPLNVTSEVTKTSIKLIWDAVPRADNYEIEADGFIIDTGATTSYSHEGLTPLTRHKYRIRATNAGGTGEWSNYIYITTHPYEPHTPDNVMASASENTIALAWYMAAYAASYEIEIDHEQIVEVTATQFQHTGLKPGFVHTYRVRAKNISGVSEWTSPVTITASSGASGSNKSITNTAAIVTTDTITLSWDAAAYGCEYEVETDGVIVNNGSNTVFNHTGLTPGSYHDYKIRVKTGDSSDVWSVILTLSTLPYPPGAPVIIDSFVSNTSIQIWWGPIKDAVSYDVEVDGEIIQGITDETFLHEGLLPGTAHQYRVRARTLTDISPWSSMLEKSTSSTTYEINCTEGEEFSFSLLAQNVQDFRGITFVVAYDGEQLEIVDLCGITPAEDNMPEGNIPGTNLYVKQRPGIIEFTVTGSIVPGTAWSGEITAVKFRAKSTCTTYIDFREE